MGTPAQKPWILSMLVLAISLSGCGGKSKSEDGAEDLPSDDSAAAATSPTDSVPGGLSGDSSAVSTASGGPVVPGTTPRIREAPFERAGKWLNAFYFTRSGEETWEAVSQRLYGSPAQAEELKSWNPRAHLATPGALVYYSSSARPQDQTAMKHFVEDQGLAYEDVEVKRGDSLSRIAAARYGQAGLWKELAVLNPSLKSPNFLVPGTTIKASPSGNTPGAAPMMSHQLEEPRRTVAETPPAQAPRATSPTQIAPPQQPKVASPDAAAEDDLASSPIARIMQWVRSNIVLAGGGGLAVLLILGTAVRRARALRG